MKYITIVPDGMFDEPVEALGGKTPMEAAKTPNMDRMAQEGIVGEVQTIPDGLPPGSDIGNMALLGYDPTECHTGRSPLEGANLNVFLKDNQVSFRCNLVTIRDGVMDDYSASHITTEQAEKVVNLLEKSLGNNNAKFYLGKSYRHLLVLTINDPQTLMALQTTPPHDIIGQKIEDYLPKGEGQDLVRSFMDSARMLLENQSDANGIWLWGQGTRPKLKSFESEFGKKGGVISAVDLVQGIGRLAGLQIIDVPGITGYYDTNYKGKGEYGLKFVEENDFVYIHVESPDEAGHNGDWKEKVRAIENIDEHIVGAVQKFCDARDDVRVLISPDHPTPVNKRTHTSDHVGFILYGSGIDADSNTEYSEKICLASETKVSSGKELVEKFFS